MFFEFPCFSSVETLSTLPTLLVTAASDVGSTTVNAREDCGASTYENEHRRFSSASRTVGQVGVYTLGRVEFNNTVSHFSSTVTAALGLASVIHHAFRQARQ